MKKLLALSVAIAFAAGPAGEAVAQTTPPPVAEKKADDKKMSSKSASGTVKSAGPDTIVVAGKVKGKDAEWTFAVDAKTAIKKGSKAMTPGDVKPGDSVKVRYHEMDGKTIAHAVTVTRSAMVKKDATKPVEKK